MKCDGLCVTYIDNILKKAEITFQEESMKG